MAEMEPMGLRHEAEIVFARMTEEVYRLNRSKGWFDTDRTVGDMVALAHAEISEVLEAYRDHGMADATATKPEFGDDEDHAVHIAKPEGVGAEMADVLIRVLDMCKRWDIDLVAEYDRKMQYNWTRPYRHGRKTL